MRRIFFACFLIVACATGASAHSFDDGVSAFQPGNDALAMRLLHPFAEKNDAKAQKNLGWLYYIGQGVPKDPQGAVRSWRLAAEEGDTEGLFNLGVMYDKGQGVSQDFIRAYMWYHLAAAASSGADAMVAIKLRDRVASRMTAAQIGKSQEMARHCEETKFKECD
jgi:TPR repeat protein